MSRIWTPSRRLQRGFFTLPGGMGSAFPEGGPGPTPPPYDTDLVVHFDAADLSTLALSGSDVDSWTCKASAQVWSQTGANRPVVSTSIFAPRGVNFDASGNNKWLTGSAISLPVPYTLFIVCNFPNIANTAIGLYGGAVSTTRDFGHLVFSSGGTQRYLQTVWEASPLNYAVSVPVNASPDKLAALFYSTSSNSTSLELERDRTAVVDIRAGSNTYSSFDMQFIGSNVAGLPSQGEIAEVVCYNRSLNGTERTAVYDYLSAKWGTP